MNTTNYIRIFRGDDSDALGYQTIVGTIKTDIDLTGCKAVFRFLGFYAEFNPIPEDKKLTIVIPAQASRGFPPGVGYASLKVFDSLGKIRTFTNRIPVIVDTMTPSCGCGEFEVSFSPFPELEPLKIFIGPNADDFDQYTGFVSKIIDRASLVKYGLAILADAMSEDGGASGKAASPLAVKAAYDAIIKELVDNYYTAKQTDEAIDRVAAYYITYTAAGAAFPTYAALANATTVYSGGKIRVPTRNDYCVVLADEMHQGAEYRYIYAVAEGQTTGSWQPQFPVEGVMTVDQTVQKNSQNPVSGGGVWSMIWGALSALPTGFSSLYDWCVSQLAGKVPTSRTINGKALSSDVTLTGADIAVSGTDATKIDAALALIAPDWVQTSAYSAYDCVKYNGAYYYAKNDIAANTAWNANNWGSLANLAAVVKKFLPLTGGRVYSDIGIGIGYEMFIGADGTARAPENGIWWSEFSGYNFPKCGIQCGSLSGDLVLFSGGAQISLPTISGTLALLEDIAPVFSTSATYAVNALCVYEGVLYRCTTAITTAEAWTEAHWTEATVEDVLAALRTGKADASAIPYSLGTLTIIDTASSEVVEGETVNYGAATLADRTANIVQVTAATALDELRITFPAATNGKVRDFGLRVEIGTGSAALTAPSLVPIAPTGETIKLENADGTIPELADGTATAKGVTLLYFSENAPGVFVVKSEQVEEVA